mmetsp:Transcript_3709/g.9548  ORF Transcript_3709/g.9548 Transcript_3709/m.9548 type:complete len:202 (+) Transcript_3709:54-659(+)
MRPPLPEASRRSLAGTAPRCPPTPPPRWPQGAPGSSLSRSGGGSTTRSRRQLARSRPHAAPPLPCRTCTADSSRTRPRRHTTSWRVSTGVGRSRTSGPARGGSRRRAVPRSLSLDSAWAAPSPSAPASTPVMWTPSSRSTAGTAPLPTFRRCRNRPSAISETSTSRRGSATRVPLTHSRQSSSSRDAPSSSTGIPPRGTAL